MPIALTFTPTRNRSGCVQTRWTRVGASGSFSPEKAPAAIKYALQLLAVRWQLRVNIEPNWARAWWMEGHPRYWLGKQRSEPIKALGKAIEESKSPKPTQMFSPSSFYNVSDEEVAGVIFLRSHPSGTKSHDNALEFFDIFLNDRKLDRREEAILFTELACEKHKPLVAHTGESLVSIILAGDQNESPWLTSLRTLWQLENAVSLPRTLRLEKKKLPLALLAPVTALDQTTSALADSFPYHFRSRLPGRGFEMSWPGGDEDIILLQNWSAECRATKKDRLRSEVLAVMASLLKHYRELGSVMFNDNKVKELPTTLTREISRTPDKLLPLATQITLLSANNVQMRKSEELVAIKTHQERSQTWSLKIAKLDAKAANAAGPGDLLPTWTCALMEKPYGLKDTAEAEGLVPNGMVYQWALIADNDDYNNLIQNADDKTAKRLSSTLIELVKELNHKTENPRQITPAMKTDTNTENVKRSESRPHDDFIFEVGDVVPDYYGRTKEKSELGRILMHSEDNNFLIHAAVTKLGGIGKTQLARRFAHSVKSKQEAVDRKHPFQGGIVEINLRAHNYSPDSSKDGISTTSAELDPVAVMKEVLTLFRVSETQLDKLTTKEQLSEFYHSFFLHRNALLILDNAKDYEQVKELLPRPGSTTRAIVTARDDIKGLTPVTLKAWSLEEIEGYLSEEQSGGDPYRELTRWCKTDEQRRELLQSIYRLSHGLPLVLHMLSAFALATESAGKQTVVELLEARLAELAEGNQCTPDIAVGAMIDLSLHLLDETKQRHFLALSIFRVHFDAAAATTLTGRNTVSLPDVVAELNLFARLGLLMKETVATIDHKQRGEVELSGYRMHDLVRQAASERLVKLLDHAGIAELERKYVTHYLGAQAYQNELLLANPHTLSGELREMESTFDVGAVWFDREEQNYDVAFDLCSKKRMKDQTLRDELLSLTAGVGTRVCDLLMAVEKRLKRVSEGRDAAERLAEKATTKDAKVVCGKLVAMHTNSLGLAHRHKGNRADARKLFTEAMKLSKDLKWEEGITIGTGNRGNIYQEDASEAKTPDEKASYLKQALECHFAALEISERIHLQLSEGQDNGNAAIVLIDQWDLGKWKDDDLFEKASKHYAKRNSVAGMIGDERGLGNGEGNLASANLLKYIRSNPQDPETREEVLEGYMRAYKHHKKARNPRGMAACIGNLGRAELILACSGDAAAPKLMADARIHFEESLAIFVKVGDLLGQRTALVHRRAWFLANDQDAKAKADEKEIEKCESLAGVPPLSLLSKGMEQSLPRHLADKYGKLSHIDLSDRAIVSAYGASKAVATAKDVCAEYLKLQIAGSSKAEAS